jgi:hypothetical protein
MSNDKAVAAVRRNVQALVKLLRGKPEAKRHEQAIEEALAQIKVPGWTMGTGE